MQGLQPRLLSGFPGVTILFYSKFIKKKNTLMESTSKVASICFCKSWRPPQRWTQQFNRKESTPLRECSQSVNY